MQIDTDLIAEEDAPADAWAGIVAADHAAIHAQLDQLTAEYLARGGAIAVIEPGQPAAAPTPINYLPEISQYTGEQHRSHHQSTRKMSRYPSDSAWVASIAVHLDAVTSAIDLRRVMGRTGHPCCADKLDRLLRVYFADDPRAIPLLHKSREEVEANVVASYPELRRTMCQSECAKALHMHHCDLKRIVALHGLDRRLEAVS